jgi:sulfotransferase
MLNRLIQKKVAFNSSMPRSGSTLLQNILAQNPRFYTSPTSGLTLLLLDSRRGYSMYEPFKAQDEDVMRRAFSGFCEGAVMGYYSKLTDRPVCVDKSRDWFYYYDWLRTFYPDPKILICIRDLRAVISSMEKLYLKYPDYLDSGDDQYKMQMITKSKRVLYWLNTPPVGLTLSRLVDAIERENTRYFHFVRFEDITTDPERIMRGVYEYLGEPYFDHDFSNVEQRTHENDVFYLPYGRHIIRRKVEPICEDYIDILGQDLCDNIRAGNEAFYRAFYPENEINMHDHDGNGQQIPLIGEPDGGRLSARISEDAAAKRT